MHLEYITIKDILDITGLFFGFLGSLYLGKGLFITNKKALELGVAKWAGNKDEKNLKLPQVKDKIAQRQDGWVGAIFISISFVFQIITHFI